MKTSFQFLLFLLLLTFSDAKAQKSDSTGTTPIMKRKSQIFMAEIKTDAGTQKGILYEADSSGIVILDSLYQQVSIPLKSIKFIRINRSNSGWHGFKVGIIVGAAYIGLVTVMVASAFPQTNMSSGSSSGLGILLPFSVLTTANGLLFALLSKNVPNMYVDALSPDEYFKKLKRLRAKSQRFLIEKYPNRVVLR
jgi:hypothetical protein